MAANNILALTQLAGLAPDVAQVYTELSRLMAEAEDATEDDVEMSKLQAEKALDEARKLISKVHAARKNANSGKTIPVGAG